MHRHKVGHELLAFTPPTKLVITYLQGIFFDLVNYLLPCISHGFRIHCIGFVQDYKPNYSIVNCYNCCLCH